MLNILANYRYADFLFSLMQKKYIKACEIVYNSGPWLNIQFPLDELGLSGKETDKSQNNKEDYS